MSHKSSEELGTKSISRLIFKQSVPASIGILVMSLNLIVDTIFVGNWIGATAIAVVTIVLPIVFLIASVGMAIGIGGASVISRALGDQNVSKAHQTFGNQIVLAVLVPSFLALIGVLLRDEALALFGAKGGIIEPAQAYYGILMSASPFLALIMTGNPVIRAEGKPRFSMVAMIVTSIADSVLDYIFIVVFDYGIVGAAWATIMSYFASFLFVFWFFISSHSELKIKLKCFTLKRNIVSEITSLGGVTLARQGTVSLMFIVLNHTLFSYGGEESLAIYGIINRMLMFALFPIMGIAQGFMPIAGYNFGANKIYRLKETINKSILYASIIGLFIFSFIMVFPEAIVRVFTDDSYLLSNTPNALRIVFGATLLIPIQLIGSAYFQAIGRARPALFLTLSKQGFFLIPLILTLPLYFGVIGVWIAFPIADLLSTILSAFFLRKDLNKKMSLHRVSN